MHFFLGFLQHSFALDFAFYCSKAWPKLHNVHKCNVQPNWCFLLGYIAQTIGTARLKLQHLQTMTLITQHKPVSDRKIEWYGYSHDQKISNSSLAEFDLYTEKRYGQHTASKHVHAGRHPGVPAPVMIQRNTSLHHPFAQRTIRCSRHSVNR